MQQLGFREADAYDHRGYTGRLNTRLSGTIPAGRLETLLKDLRGQPAGWIAPRVNLDHLPAPLRLVNPIVVTEVLADGEPLKTVSDPAPRMPDYLEKISPDLWAMLQGKENALVRLHLILLGQQAGDDRSIRSALTTAAPNFQWEGSVGHTVTGVAPIGQIKALAALPEVSVIRLARPARTDIDPALTPVGDPKKALTLTELDTPSCQGTTRPRSASGPD